MESLIVITISIIAGGVLFAYSSNRKAKLEAQRIAEAAARRKQEEERARQQRIAEEEARRKIREIEEQARQRRIAEEEARRKQEREEAERQAAFRESIRIAIKNAVKAAVEATIIGTGITKNENKVVHIVASAIEAAGVADSSDASVQTHASAIDAALKTALTDAISRTSRNATLAASRAASLEPSDRSRIIRAARISAIEVSITNTIVDLLAGARGSNEFQTIANVRKHTRTHSFLKDVGAFAQEIEQDRLQHILRANESESERIEAIIDAIEPVNDNYTRIASSLAARKRAHVIKEARSSIRNETANAIIERATDVVFQFVKVKPEVTEEATVAIITATLSTEVIDKIEDAIDDAIALTCMRTGDIANVIEPSIANSLQISCVDVIMRMIEAVQTSMREDPADEEEATGLSDEADADEEEATGVSDEVDANEEDAIELHDEEITRMPIENYESLPKLKHPAGYVYVIQDVSHTKQYKIGRTTNPEQRMNAFGVELPFATEIAVILRTNDATRLERQLHDQYKEYRGKGEWFDLEVAHVFEILQMENFK